MTRTDFKIIVDLTHVFHDARKFTLVYIDATKIWHIKQLQDHLIELFKIPEPFHLLSTGKTYLPPSEDVRILDPNDTVTVIQGTGLTEIGSAEITKSFVTTNATCNSTNGSEPGDVLNGTSRISNKSDCDNSSVQIVANSIRDEKSYKSFNKSNSILGTTTNQTIYHTIIDDSTVLDSNSKVEEVDSTKESTGIGEQNLSSKKKRVRHRKKKFNNSSDQDSNVAKKPRVVSNVTVPTGKHIRFDAPDNDSDSSGNDNTDRSTLSNLSGFARKTPMKNLDNLLALRQTSTPLTFIHKKAEPEIAKPKDEPMSTSETKDESVVMLNKTSNKSDKSNQNMDIDKKGAQVKVGDIVDFKILKIGEDYCPILSNIITAEVISVSSDSKSYELKITSGKGETQGPNGKFALPDDSNVTDSETITYNRDDMLELQIIRSA